MAAKFPGLLVAALAVLVLLALAAAAHLLLSVDSADLLRVQRRIAWLRLPELARQHWGVLPPPERAVWLRIGAEAWAARPDADRPGPGPGTTFETLAIELAYEAFLAGGGPGGPLGAAPAPPGLDLDPGAGPDRDEVVWAVDRAFAAADADRGALVAALDRAFAAARGAAELRPAGAGAERLARAAAGENLPAAPGLAAEVVAAAVLHTDDTENVHDSLLLAGLGGVLARLRAEQAGHPLPDLGAIAASLADAGAGAGPGSLPLAAAALGGLQPAAPVAGLQGASDAECLQRVWLRAEAPANAGPSGPLLRRALFDALVACWDGGALACAGGRAARFLSAPAGVDADPSLWAGTRLEDLRNEVFAEAGALIRAHAAAAASSEDPGRRLAGLAYLAASGAEAAALEAPPPEAAEAFAAELRGALGALVDDRCAAFAGGPGRAPALCALLRRQALAAV